MTGVETRCQSRGSRDMLRRPDHDMRCDLYMGHPGFHAALIGCTSTTTWNDAMEVSREDRRKYWERATLAELAKTLDEEELTSTAVLSVLRRLLREVNGLIIRSNWGAEP